MRVYMLSISISTLHLKVYNKFVKNFRPLLQKKFKFSNNVALRLNGPQINHDYINFSNGSCMLHHFMTVGYN